MTDFGHISEDQSPEEIAAQVEEAVAKVRPDGVYIIYSADIVGPETDIDKMDPTHVSGYREAFEEFVQTEGDEQYDFGYLADEDDRADYLPVADGPEYQHDCEGCEFLYTTLRRGSKVDVYRSCSPEDSGYVIRRSSDPADYMTTDDLERAGCEIEPAGRHRKWVAELTPERWQRFADVFCIDLDEDTLVPTNYEETMGSITEHGHIPAVAVDNTEGWSPMHVIMSQMYVSFYTNESEVTA